jgi:hypothetical protein
MDYRYEVFVTFLVDATNDVEAEQAVSNALYGKASFCITRVCRFQEAP